MEWALRWADSEDYLWTVYEASGVLPAPLASKPPTLRDDLQELLECFWLLAESRPVGMGSASGITTADIMAAAAAWDFEPTRFLAVIRELDRVFLAHLHEAAKRASTKGST